VNLLLVVVLASILKDLFDSVFVAVSNLQVQVCNPSVKLL
jgi:hypothetical protein